jgi:hypothetical protein
VERPSQPLKQGYRHVSFAIGRLLPMLLLLLASWHSSHAAGRPQFIAHPQLSPLAPGPHDELIGYFFDGKGPEAVRQAYSAPSGPPPGPTTVRGPGRLVIPLTKFPVTPFRYAKSNPFLVSLRAENQWLFLAPWQFLSPPPDNILAFTKSSEPLVQTYLIGQVKSALFAPESFEYFGLGPLVMCCPSNPRTKRSGV